MEQTQYQQAYLARVQLARTYPRDWAKVREQLLAECKRPRFAEAARYTKPVPDGQTVSDLSVKFVEAALRIMGNTLPETVITGDDENVRKVKVLVTDLETNITHAKEVLLDKQAERRTVKPTETVLGTRPAMGGSVFLVRATPDDLANGEAALASVVLRQLGLKLLPADIRDECLDQIVHTLEQEAARDPLGQMQTMLRGFAALGVDSAKLIAYMGTPAEAWTPAELARLRSIYQALRDRETTWNAVMEQRVQVMGYTQGGPKPAAVVIVGDQAAATKVGSALAAIRNKKPIPQGVGATICDDAGATPEAPSAGESTAHLESTNAPTGLCDWPEGCTDQPMPYSTVCAKHEYQRKLKTKGLTAAKPTKRARKAGA